MSQLKNIKIIILISILASLASIIGIIDKIVSSLIIPNIPGIKIGLANIIIIYAIYKYDFKVSFLIALLKAVIVGLLFGSISSFIIGGVSTIISYLVMVIVYKFYNKYISTITISILGGFVHINTQLLIIKIMYKLGNEIYMYGAILITISLITSIIVGYLANKLNKVNINTINI